MSHSINNPPPHYTNHEDVPAQVSQCTTFMLALVKLFHTLTVTVKGALLGSSTEKIAADKVIKEATHIEEVYSDYLRSVRLCLPDLESYVLRYTDFIIPMVLGTKFTIEEQKAELDVFLKKTPSAIPAAPQELAPGVESVSADSLTLIVQLVKDADVNIEGLKAQQADKTVALHDLEAELKKTPLTEKAKRDALKKEIATVEDQLEDIQIAIGVAEEKKEKYSAAHDTIPNITKEIGNALIKGPDVLLTVLTDVFQNVKSDANKVRKCLEDGSPIDKDELEKETVTYKKIEAALKQLAIG